MILIGLTGGIGTGKTTSSDWLQSRTVPVADTDLIARELVQPGQPALHEVVAAFGSGLLQTDGCLDRAALAKRVFNDSAARHSLEQILHPRIRQEWKARATAWRERNLPVAAVVIPLLFETGAAGDFDLVVCTACTAATQRRRLEARGWDAAQIQGRLDAQWPLGEKIAHADAVIWTEGAVDLIGEQWCRLCDRRGRSLFPSS